MKRLPTFKKKTKLMKAQIKKSLDQKTEIKTKNAPFNGAFFKSQLGL